MISIPISLEDLIDSWEDRALRISAGVQPPCQGGSILRECARELLECKDGIQRELDTYVGDRIKEFKEENGYD